MLGGSFNPAHAGHRELSLAALTHLHLHEIWWLVSPGNPLKDASLYEAYEKRCSRALKIAAHPRIKISTFEARKDLTYTVDTLGALKKEYEDDQFVWLMGADSLENFHLWHDWKKILELVPVAVFNRPPYEAALKDSVAAKAYERSKIEFEDVNDFASSSPPAWVFVPYPDNDLSSTKIRNAQNKTLKKKKIKTRMALTGPKYKDIPNATNENDIAMKKNTKDKKASPLVHLLDFNPTQSDFLADVIEGLSKSQKSLSPKYFYDETGSQIFEQITNTKDYYPTRTELSLMRKNLDGIKSALGPAPAIFEYGSGASEKIRYLIENLDGLMAYTAMDISRDFLLSSAHTLAKDYADLSVSAVCADFQNTILLPDDFHPEIDAWTGYFPGSTIGNFAPGTAQDFLSRVSETLGGNAKFLMGFDLIKDGAILNRAYNDDEGITAAFNLNLLTRMEKELNARLVRDDFEHYAFYNRDQNRIEMHLRAIKATKIIIETPEAETYEFSFSVDETLLTEFSYKYNRETMEAMIEQTPWELSHYWTDEKDWFATCLLRNS